MKIYDIHMMMNAFINQTGFRIEANRIYLTISDWNDIMTDREQSRSSMVHLAKPGEETVCGLKITVIYSGASHLAYDPFLEN